MAAVTVTDSDHRAYIGVTLNGGTFDGSTEGQVNASDENPFTHAVTVNGGGSYTIEYEAALFIDGSQSFNTHLNPTFTELDVTVQNQSITSSSTPSAGDAPVMWWVSNEDLSDLTGSGVEFAVDTTYSFTITGSYSELVGISGGVAIYSKDGSGFFSVLEHLEEYTGTESSNNVSMSGTLNAGEYYFASGFFIDDPSIAPSGEVSSMTLCLEQIPEPSSLMLLGLGGLAGLMRRRR